MRFLFTVAACLICLFNYNYGQIASWNAISGTGSTGATAGTASLGAGLTETAVGACGNNVFTTVDIFDTGDPNPTTSSDAISDDEYIEFPITSNTGYTLTITSVTFSGQKSNTGGNNSGVFNGTTDISNGGITWSGTGCGTRTISISPALVINSGTTINLRLYVWGATGSTGSWRVGSFQVFGSVLPIKVKSFDVVKTNSASKLILTTASETNNDYFTIERSIDGVEFDAIGEIKGAGNSSSELQYEFVDENPLPGINYYRIKQTDFDGKYSYTEIKSVRHNIGKITVSPLRTDGRLQVTSTQDNYDVVLYTAAGQEVYRSNGLNGDQTINIETLDAGMYFVKIVDQTFKIFKY